MASTVDPYEVIKNPEKVLLLVHQFIEEQRITSSETVYQSEHVIENAYEFLEEICNAAGYAEDDEEEDEEDITDFGFDEDNPYGEDEDY